MVDVQPAPVTDALMTDVLPAPVAALFPGAAERARVEDWLGRELAAALLRIRSGPVVPTLDMRVSAPSSRNSISRRRARSNHCCTGPCSDAARHRADGQSALFRPVQPRRGLSGAMRRPHREPVQSAARELRLLARAGGTREPRDTRRGAPRGPRSRCHRAFRHRRFGGKLHRAHLRADRGASALRGRGRARVPRRAAVLHLA
jgi:hypothetical protein